MNKKTTYLAIVKQAKFHQENFLVQAVLALFFFFFYSWLSFSRLSFDSDTASAPVL